MSRQRNGSHEEDKIIRIEKVVAGGKGLSRDLQKVTLVPFTLPGETVRVKIRREHKDYIEAEALEIVEPSPLRKDPECRYFGVCGGCQLSHTSYANELLIKQQIFAETFERNKLPVPELRVMSDQPYSYRHRIQLKVDQHTGHMGFFEPETNKVVEIHECLCVTPGLNSLIAALRTHSENLKIQGLKEIECFENEKGEVVAYFNSALPQGFKKVLEKQGFQIFGKNDLAHSPVQVQFREHFFPMRPDIFLQVNPRLWKAMVMEVESHHETATDDETAVELYCGAGFFTIPLSRFYRKIFACEENSAAIQYAVQNRPPKNISWIQSKAEDYIFPPDIDAVVVDPPRAGLHKRIVQTLLLSDLKRITYVSCDVTSLARDLRQLLSKYRIAQAALIDLFPQTHHFETILLLHPIR